METKVNYTLVGAFVVMLTLAIGFSILWLSSVGTRKAYDRYVIYMSEAVSGLNKQASVKYNGVDVGFVEQIKIDRKNLQRVRLLVKIEEETPITESTTATLVSLGITGLTYIELSTKEPQSPRLKKKPGERFPVIKSQPSLLVQIDTILRDAMSNVELLTKHFGEIFSKETATELKKTLDNMAEITETLARNSSRIDQSIKDASITLQNTAKISEELPTITQQLKNTLTATESTTKRIAEASKNVSLTMSESRIAIQNFSRQTIPDTSRVMTNLENILNNLERLTDELQQQPGLIFHGKTTPPPGPGEE